MTALRSLYRFFSTFLVDPLGLLQRWRSLPYFFCNARKWRAQNGDPTFRIRLADCYITSWERHESAGSVRNHYFWQDLWAATTILASGSRRHVDVGSRLDGFVAHLLPSCFVTYIDLRETQLSWPNFESKVGSVLALPFADDSVPSLSCLHVIEHIGLGRYGDPIDPQGHRKAAAELERVLLAGGRLLIGTPVGRARVCFDAHRVFDPQSVCGFFPNLRLVEFHLIDDAARGILRNASWAQARACEYGCGLYVFEKTRPMAIS